MGSNPDRNRDAWNLLCACVGLIGLLAAAELAVRHFVSRSANGAPYSPFFEAGNARPAPLPFELPMSDPLLGWARAAPFREYVSHAVPPEERVRDFGAPGTGARRVVALGGSTTDPWLVEKNWVFRLNEHCDSAGLRCRFLNGGVTAYNSNQELLKLVRDVIPLKPDLVVSLSGVNDEAIGDSIGRTFVNAQQSRLENAVVVGDWHSHSPFSDPPRIGGPFPYLRVLARELAYRRSPPRPPAAPPKDGLTRGQRWEANMRSMHALAREHGFDYLMILQPHLALEPDVESPTRKAFAFTMNVERVLEFYREARAACSRAPYCIDLSGALQGHSEVFRDSVHINEDGHAIEADRIFTILRKRKLL